MQKNNNIINNMRVLIREKQKYNLILCPPPNLTGSLHTGHILNLTLIDFHTRYNYNFQDKNTVSVIGYDHAGLSAEIIAKKTLDKNCNKNEIIKEIEKNKKQFKEKICLQIEKYNFAIINTDFSTIDSLAINIVQNVLHTLEKNFLITYELQLYFYDIENNTIISDSDVEAFNTDKKLYTIKYFLKNSQKYVCVATTQPGTIESDVCLAFNPEDKRYFKYYNQIVINPLNNNELKILMHKNVNMCYGTGILKISPVYDRKDFEIAKDLNINYQNIPYNTENFYMNKNSIFNGKKINQINNIAVEILNKKNLIEKVENVVGKTYKVCRSGNIALTLISWQYCIALQKLVEKSKYSYNDLAITGSSGKNEIDKFIKNLKNWTITRQNNYGIDYKKNKLDTWVASSLYGYMILSKLGINKNIVNITIYTGYDIVFYWIYKMHYMQQVYKNEKTIDNVIVHGLICDSKGNKMSKSKGNVINIDFETNTECENYKAGIICLNVFDKRITYDQNKINIPTKTITKIKNIILLLQKKFNFNNYKYINTLENIKDSLIYALIINYINGFILDNYIECIKKITFFHYFIKNYFGNIFIESFKKNIDKNKNYNYYNQIIFSLLLLIIKYISCFMPIQSQNLWNNICEQKLQDIQIKTTQIKNQICSNLQNVIKILQLQIEKKIYTLTVISNDIDINNIFYYNSEFCKIIFECEKYKILYNKKLDKNIAQVNNILKFYSFI